MARVKMTDQQATALRERPVAKKKGAVRERQEDAELEKGVKVVRTRKTDEIAQPQGSNAVSAGAVKGVVAETLARCYTEIWPSMTTHDENDNVDLEITEEAHIVTLTIYVGDDGFQPRKRINLKEDTKGSATMTLCRKCED